MFKIFFFCSIKEVTLGATIARVAALKQIGGFDRRIKGAGEDVDIKIRMLIHGWDYLINDEAIFSYPKSYT
jgi:GT2 family glycosyltransferase